MRTRSVVADNQDRIPILFAERDFELRLRGDPELGSSAGSRQPAVALGGPKRVLDVAAVIRRFDFGNLPQRGGRNSWPLVRAAGL